MNNDIQGREDLIGLITAFYDVAVTDDEIGHHFSHLDLDTHIPVIVDFWEKALFGKPVYYGNTMAVHQVLDSSERMLPSHFVRWVDIFIVAVDSRFAGPNAEAAKLRARMVAESMSQRLNVDSRFSELSSERRLY